LWFDVNARCGPVVISSPSSTDLINFHTSGSNQKQCNVQSFRLTSVGNSPAMRPNDRGRSLQSAKVGAAPASKACKTVPVAGPPSPDRVAERLYEECLRAAFDAAMSRHAPTPTPGKTGASMNLEQFLEQFNGSVA
jgi:hypothetical protein